MITFKKVWQNSILLFTDTNSLIHEIKTEDVYEGFRNNKEMFDFSNYSVKSKYYNNSNKLVTVKRKMKQLVLRLKNFSD